MISAMVKKFSLIKVPYRTWLPCRGVAIGLVVLIVILDQMTKSWAAQMLDYAVPIQILPILDFTRLHNDGMAFSLLAGLGWQRWLLVAVSCGAVVVFSYLLLFSCHSFSTWQRMALVLILGGALGNLVDRITLGYVIDFIAFHYRQYYFPTFNIADASISSGAILWLLGLWLNQAKSRKL